ncbi:MAG: tannase/feruloyl esterase family alpha/beta hydrolase [Deltaproteobacteria bacterium]|nr:tannase/feruloyl esterase family alpha/beta hydrolase [Deltaproteobacteria bacterium]
MMNRIKRILIASTAAFTLTALPALAASTCDDLASMKIRDGRIDSASIVEAGQFKPPAAGFMMGGPGGVNPFQNTPAFCRVTATLTPTPDSDIKIEVWMPKENWNGKLVGIGNGVWAGTIGHSSMAEPVSRGYAAVATDTGHTGMGMDAKWAIGHREKLVDFGHRAVHEMTVKAKEIMAVYYGKKEEKSYWVSCSTGGRQGLMAAYRYPDDYDGISSMAPANPMVGLMIGSLWSGYVALKDDAHKLTQTELMLSNRAYIDKCDEIDGVKDGLVSWPEMCNYEPDILECGKDKKGDCLTAAQLEALSNIYEGVKNPRTGELVFPGFTPGSEQMLAMLAGGPEPFPAAVSYFRDIVFKDPSWDYKSFDYDKDLAASYRAASDILDVPPDGLSKFFKSGGKLLLSHGWADGLIPAENTVAFYKKMKASMDKDKIRDSARLFMIPGMGHCSGGNGPSVVDMLGVIDAWVTDGKAPDKIIASTPANNPMNPNQKQMTRPLCPYPEVSVYKGTGSTDDAANFECKVKE